MGTTHWARGAITFDPPLTHAELRHERFAPYIVLGNEEEVSDRDVMLVVETEDVETDDGVLSRRYAKKIIPAWPDGKNYNFAQELATLVDRLSESGPRTFAGEIILMRETRTIDADFTCHRITVDETDMRRGLLEPVVHIAPLVAAWGEPQPVYH